MLSEIIACSIGLVLFVISSIGLIVLRFRREGGVNVFLLRSFYCMLAMAVPLALHLPLAAARFRAAQLLGHVPLPYIDIPNSIGENDSLYRYWLYLVPYTSLFVIGAMVGGVYLIVFDTRWNYITKRDRWIIIGAVAVACGYVLSTGAWGWWSSADK